MFPGIYSSHCVCQRRYCLSDGSRVGRISCIRLKAEQVITEVGVAQSVTRCTSNTPWSFHKPSLSKMHRDATSNFLFYQRFATYYLRKRQCNRPSLCLDQSVNRIPRLRIYGTGAL